MKLLLLFLSLLPVILSAKYSFVSFRIHPESEDSLEKLKNFTVRFYSYSSTAGNLQWIFAEKVHHGTLRHANGAVVGHAITNIGDKVLAEIKIDDSPFAQDTFSVVISNDKKNAVMKIITDELKMKIVARGGAKDLSTKISSLTGCHCIPRACSCCLTSQVPHFQHEVCVNSTYNPTTIGLDLSIGIDGHYFTEEISVRNPPPICYSIPGLHDVASLCLGFHDLNVANKHLTGCVDFEAELIHMRVVRADLGCFNMPI